MIWSVVDFPAPLAPSNANASPGAIGSDLEAYHFIFATKLQVSMKIAARSVRHSR
jgi:hypothetical protein